MQSVSVKTSADGARAAGLATFEEVISHCLPQFNATIPACGLAFSWGLVISYLVIIGDLIPPLVDAAFGGYQISRQAGILVGV